MLHHLNYYDDKSKITKKKKNQDRYPIIKYNQYAIKTKQNNKNKTKTKTKQNKTNKQTNKKTQIVLFDLMVPLNEFI